MKNGYLPAIFLASFLLGHTATAKMPDIDTSMKKILPPIKKFYIGSAMDGAIFSTALIQKTSGGTTTTSFGTIRFTYVINSGLTFNYNFGRHFGAYTGIDIKNIGFIEKNTGAETVKRRTYNIGVPLGIKIGNMVERKPYIFLGGGLDVPFNYREKTFVIRDQKTKFSEWFSDRTPATMPFVFFGAAINQGVTFKVQYYPGNFLNPDFTAKDGTKPYAGYDVQLILFTIGLAVPFSKQHDAVKESASQLHIM